MCDGPASTKRHGTEADQPVSVTESVLSVGAGHPRTEFMFCLFISHKGDSYCCDLVLIQRDCLSGCTYVSCYTVRSSQVGRTLKSCSEQNQIIVCDYSTLMFSCCGSVTHLFARKHDVHKHYTHLADMLSSWLCLLGYVIFIMSIVS